MKVFNIIRKLEEILLIISMVTIVFFIFGQAFFRYFTGSGIVWGEELSRYVLVAQTWIGSSLAIKKGVHIRITFFRDLFKTRGKKFLDLLSTGLFFSFMFFIAYKGTFFIFELIDTGQRSPSMGILMAIPYTVIPLGATLMLIRLIQQFIKILNGKLLDEQIEGAEK